MQHGNFFIARIITYVFLITALVVGSWYAYPLLQKHQQKSFTIFYDAPLLLSSTDISLNGVKMALEQRAYRAGNAAIKLVVVDDGDKDGAWVESRERKNAEAAAADPSTVAFIGPLNSGAAKISMPILNQAGIIQISPSNTWPGLTKTGFLPGEPGVFYPTGQPHYVRVATTDDLQGPAGAMWANELGFKSVYVVNDSDPYGVGIANLFEREAKNIGISVLGSNAITVDASTTATVAEEIIALHPDLVYYGGLTTDGGPELLKYLRGHGNTSAFMGPDGIFEQEFISKAGASAAEGIYITAIGVPPAEAKTPTAAAFVKNYKERFHSEPDVFGALAYDATTALLDAIDRVSSGDKSAILKEVKSIRSQPGIFGNWGFDKNGDTTLTLMSGNIVKNGTFEFNKILKVE